MSKPKAILIMGSTGIGKSSISSKLTNLIGGELLSVDSVKLYRGLTIGAHKVYSSSSTVRLYDLADPSEHFSAEKFCRAATEATKEVLANGRVPVFFGGASMYAEWFFFGSGSNENATDPELLAQVERELRGLGSWEKASQVAEKLDPTGLSLLGKNDYYRLARLVHVGRRGKPFSSVSGFEKPQIEMDLRGVFLHPRDRLKLYRSLDRRCEKMLADGLLEETVLLMKRFKGELPRKISTVVGYKQAFEFLQTNPKEISRLAFHKFLSEFQDATRNYARRQLTYFRGSEKLQSVLCDFAADPSDESSEQVVQFLKAVYEMTPEEYASEIMRKFDQDGWPGAFD